MAFAEKRNHTSGGDGFVFRTWNSKSNRGKRVASDARARPAAAAAAAAASDAWRIKTAAYHDGIAFAYARCPASLIAPKHWIR